MGKQRSPISIVHQSPVNNYTAILVQVIIILSLDISVQIQKVLDIMTIRHYGIRPCGKTPFPPECLIPECLIVKMSNPKMSNPKMSNKVLMRCK